MRPHARRALGLAIIAAQLAGWQGTSGAAESSSEVTRLPTFNRDVAPILFEHCATCHRPGQAAPFSLLTYAQAKKHARDIAEVTTSRYMPPWLPAPGYGSFRHDRRLSPSQLSILARWAHSGSPEGDPRDLPKAPVFPTGWRLGKPDLVLTPAEPFTVPAEGKDVYRNLVLPVPLTKSHFIRGVELEPDNPRVLHHAFVNIDETRQSRRLAERQNPPGFDGMEIPPPANMPAGQFLAWQPGRVPSFAPPGLSWLLRTNTDIVLQMHLHPSGRPESIRPAIGLYFTEEAPTNLAFRIALKAFQLDIPAGDSNYVAEECYRLPVTVEVTRVETHAHYLARQMQAWAILPDGQKKWLIRIQNWDFNWQGGYEYDQPINLPAGSEVFMHYTYDNSTNNLRNPNQPPKRVRFGPQTTDEMGELWLQAMVPNPQQRPVLVRDYFAYLTKRTLDYDQFRLRIDPNNSEAHARLGHNYLAQGKLSEAASHLAKALQVEPRNARAHHDLALLFLDANRLTEAERELKTATRLDPYDSEGFGNLGYLYIRTGRKEQARQALQQALKINPDDSVAAQQLQALSTH